MLEFQHHKQLKVAAQNKTNLVSYYFFKNAENKSIGSGRNVVVLCSLPIGKQGFTPAVWNPADGRLRCRRRDRASKRQNRPAQSSNGRVAWVWLWPAFSVTAHH
jgi:hypothetical protein